MGEKTRHFEIRTVAGQVILGFSLVEKEGEFGNNSKSPHDVDHGNTGGKEASKSGDNDSLMTEAQKRYLFRLLAEHGIQGEIAHQELKSAFRVNALTEVGKFEASKMIERLLGGGIGGLKNGSSIQ